MNTLNINESIKRQNRILSLFILICFILAILLYLLYNHQTETNSALIKNNYKLSSEIKNTYSKIDSIKSIVQLSDVRLDSLKVYQIQNKINYEKSRSQVLQFKKDYQNLPVDSRDSILRTYIRANQKPYRGG